MSQTFTYLMIILVIGVLIVFGFKAYGGILVKQCEGQRATFEKDLVDTIDDYSDYGSVHEQSIRTPCDATEICFADASYCSGTPPNSIVAYTNDTVIISSVNDCTANIFIKAKFTETLNRPTKFLSKITFDPLDPPFQCFKVRNSQVKLLFSGLGSQTRIEQG